MYLSFYHFIYSILLFQFMCVLPSFTGCQLILLKGKTKTMARFEQWELGENIN